MSSAIDFNLLFPTEPISTSDEAISAGLDASEPSHNSKFLVVGEGVSLDDILEREPEVVQFTSCRPSYELVNSLLAARIVVAGVAPVIADRVAKRVLGFAGALGVSDESSCGVIGLGRVGAEVTSYLTTKYGDVAVTDIRTPKAGLLDELGVRRKTLDLLMSGSNAISIHVSDGPTSRPLITARELNLLPEGAVAINTAHSQAIEEQDVIDALRNGILFGYATDCAGELITQLSLESEFKGKLIVTTNPLTNQIGAPQQIAKFILANAENLSTGREIEGTLEQVDFPDIGDPSFWSSKMSPTS
jgi:hypothetical protein